LFNWRVIGLGNPLRGDDGIGCRVVSELEQLPLPDDIDLVDGGTGGLNIISLFEGARGLLLVDAVDMGGSPGTIIRLDKHQLLAGAEGQERIDAHGNNLCQMLQLADALGMLAELVFFGVQIGRADYETGLSEAVAAALPELLDQVKKVLAEGRQ